MNDAYDIISSEELFAKVEQNNSKSKIKVAAQKLLAAINDWPLTNLVEIKDFVVALTNEIGSPLTYQRVEIYSKNLRTVKQAWKMEALSSLLEFFEYDKAKTFEEIIIDISKHYSPK